MPLVLFLPRPVGRDSGCVASWSAPSGIAILYSRSVPASEVQLLSERAGDERRHLRDMHDGDYRRRRNPAGRTADNHGDALQSSVSQHLPHHVDGTKDGVSVVSRTSTFAIEILIKCQQTDCFNDRLNALYFRVQSCCRFFKISDDVATVSVGLQAGEHHLGSCS